MDKRESDAREVLKPCPFCGGKALHHTNDNYEFVECSRGLGNGGDCPIVPSTGWRKIRDNTAITAWNTRPDADLEAVKEAIRERKAIYEQKRDEADPLADDDRNRRDCMTHTVEAFEYLQLDLRALTGEG